MNNIINHPIAHFIYGCIWFGVGLAYWFTPLLDEIGLIGIFITGVHLVIGYYFIGNNYHYIIDSSVRKQYKLEQIQLEKERTEFEKMMNLSKTRTIGDRS